MVLEVADLLGWSADDVESKHTLDQLVLRWYLNVKKERREQEQSALYVAASLAKVLGGG